MFILQLLLQDKRSDAGVVPTAAATVTAVMAAAFASTVPENTGAITAPERYAVAAAAAAKDAKYAVAGAAVDGATPCAGAGV